MRGKTDWKRKKERERVRSVIRRGERERK